MTRRDFQALSNLRIQEARTLLEHSHHEGAYYLTGIAIECALKSAIARRVRQHDFPDKSLANAAHQHDLLALLKLAGLESDLIGAQKLSPLLASRWALVQSWNVVARYDRSISLAVSRDMFAATAARGGILPWIKQRW